MESQFQLASNGQQLQQQDVNSLGEAAALVDDRVFAELFRMAPYNGSTVSRGIMPYRHAGTGEVATVAPNGASGTVLVSPFRALVGSRTAVGTDSKKNWRDIRSSIFLGSTTALTQAVSIAANASGNPRWDLVYAAVAVDANGPTVTRKVKDPTTKVISSQSVVTTKVTSVTVAVSAGTAAASPTPPATPADSGSTYYIPLAYVRVPNGFGASSTVATTDIADIAPHLSLSTATGGTSLRPATANKTPTTAQLQSWGATGSRPATVMPASMVGSESILIAVDMSTATDTVVDTGDWRNRVTRFMTVTRATGADFAWKTGSGIPIGTQDIGSGVDDDAAVGLGATFTSASSRLAAQIQGGAAGGAIPACVTVGIEADLTTGNLKWVKDASVTSGFAFFWIEFSAPFANA
jgi:hypothetical protein